MQKINQRFKNSNCAQNIFNGNPHKKESKEELKAEQQTARK